MSRKEPCCCRLPDDRFDDVLAVESPGLAEEALNSVVVVVVPVDEVGRVYLARYVRLERPAGKRLGRRLYVRLGVVADSHGEELE